MIRKSISRILPAAPWWKATLVLALATVGLAQSPLAASGYPMCVGTCFVFNRDCVRGSQQCVCDALGGQVTTCQSCPDNDYMCVGDYPW